MEDNLQGIAECLRRIMEELGGNKFVIFYANESKNYYVQFAPSSHPTALYSEAVSDEYLEPEFALNEDQIAQLLSLGWQGPGWNFYREWEVKDDKDLLLIADIVMRTLTEVYGFSPDQELVIDLNFK